MTAREFTTDSLPERMREAAKVLGEATVRAWGDDATDDQALWTDVQLRHWATQWEAEDNAAAQREAMEYQTDERVHRSPPSEIGCQKWRPSSRRKHSHRRRLEEGHR